MDPMSALVVATAVVQFVDYGTKIVSKGRELYQSASGALARNEDLETDSRRLRELVTSMSSARSKLTTPEVAAGWVDLVNECNLTAGLLQSLLDGLKVDKKKPASIREQITKAFVSAQQARRTMVKKAQIDELAQKMSKLRIDFQSYMLAMLENQGSTTQAMLEKLSEENQRLGINLTSQVDQIKKEILAVVRRPPNVIFLASDLEKLVPKLPILLQESQTVACKTEILSSLYFPEMRDRYDQITEAENTFGWILQSNKPDLSGPAVNFIEWLRSQKQDDNTYWVSGKPGSGKSTLMKFLYRHPQTRSILKEWAGQKALVICDFYFWIAGGTQMLKSQLGLLRSLVFEVLKGNPALIEIACPERYAAVLGHTQYGPVAWTVEELLETLKKATSHKENNTRFCFFVDGLDEYEGQPQDMIYLIRRFPKSSDIKFCFASRKWNAFISEFGDEQAQRESPRQLFLEELTKNDIREYVQQKLRAEPEFKKMELQNPQSSKTLIEDVVIKAEGVFLWVYLVVASLIRGIVNADSVEELQERLREIPGELPEYFSSMLDKVEKRYKADAAKIYQIMMSTSEQPYLVMFSFLWDHNTQFGTAMVAKSYSLKEIREMGERMRPRLNARCTDLLNIVKVSGVHPLWEYKVVWLHRTVREYMEGSVARDILGQWISDDKKGTFNPDSYICQSLVAQIKRAPLKPQYLADQGAVSQLVKQFAYSARRVQDTLGDHQVNLLNELEATLNSYRQSQATHATTYNTSFWYSRVTFLQWADKENLNLYVSTRAHNDISVVEDLNQPRLAMRRNTLVGAN